MLSYNVGFNGFILAISAISLFLVPFTVMRIVQKRSKHTFWEVACLLVAAILWSLGVGLPFLSHGTLNTDPDRTLFFLGVAVANVPNLIAWWRTRSAGAA